VCADGRCDAQHPAPAHKLTDAEREQVLAVCHEPRFADLPPSQVVPRLADERGSMWPRGDREVGTLCTTCTMGWRSASHV